MKAQMPMVAALLVAFTLLLPRSGVADGRPVVVELFTSQGCSSCPPADSFLGELAKRSDVLALSFHVDYWDYIGWKDPFARGEFSNRQRRYARNMGEPSVYTPQMIIDGRFQEVGSRREMVLSRIAEARDQGKSVPIAISRAGDRLDVRIGSGSESADESKTADTPDKMAPEIMDSVWLLLIDRRHETEILRGENHGRHITNHNVVRSMRHVGYWRGGLLELSLSLAGADGTTPRGDHAAILIQHKEQGHIVGARVISLD